MRSFALAAVLVAVVLAAPVLAGPVSMVVVGDTLSDPYAKYQGAFNPTTGLPYWGSAGDKNWVEQFQGHFMGNVNIYNYAQAGATTANLLGNASTAAALGVQNSGARYGVVMAGTNDVIAFLNGQLGANPNDLIAGVATNLNGILAKVQASGPVHLVVGNIPDLADTPSVKTLLGGVPGALQNLSALVQAVNQQIAAVAHAHGAAVVDLFGLSHLFDNPVLLAGTAVPSGKVFSPDGFNPGSIPQGLISNTIMTAFGGNMSNLLLSDQALLKQAGLSPTVGPNPSYFDVSPYVLKTPEPASIVLLLGLAGGLAGARRYRRRLTND